MLSHDCKGTSYEYGATREDFYQFCQKHDESGECFENLLNLNDLYEKRYIQERFIEGQNLWDKFKEEEWYHDSNEDTYEAIIDHVKPTL